MTDQSQQDMEAFENWESQNFGTCGNVHLLKRWQAAIAYERGKSGWRPIETAPKDELIVLTDGHYIMVSRYDPLAGRNDKDGWYWWTYADMPSHWMPVKPLPSPPATQPQEMHDDL